MTAVRVRIVFLQAGKNFLHWHLYQTGAASRVRSVADLNGLLNYSGDIGVRQIYL